jgi:glycosyltransferase involved in cell wall biosynthesis
VFTELSWDITFAVIDLQSSASQQSVLRAIGVELLEKDAVESVELHLAQYGRRYDLIVISALPSALRYLTAIQRSAPAAKLIFDTTDLQHLREFRRARVTGEGGWLPMAMRTRKLELVAVEACDCTWVVSLSEKAVLEEACPGATVRLVSLIQPAEVSATPFYERAGILFIGSFPHHPNADAMRYFQDEVYPLIGPEICGDPIYVIGPDPPDWLHDRPGLHVLGYVADIRPYFDRCRLSFAPLRYGAGVNGKVILSMSYGLPVVATPVAAEGLAVTNGDSILIGDSPEQFCEAVGRLYRNEELWRSLSRSGVKVVEQHYSFEGARRGVRQTLEELALA